MKRWLVVLVPVVLLAALVAWRVQQRVSASAQPGGGPGGGMRGPQVVSVADVRLQDITNTFEAIGNVEAPFDVKLSPKASGRLDYLTVREGDPVKRGQVLARIDPSELEADVNEKEAAVAQARYRLAQAAATESATGASVTSGVRREEATLASAKAEDRQARETYNAEVAGARAGVTEASGRVAAAEAGIANARAVIRSAEANLANARARYARIQGLYRQGFTAAQDVDDARTQVQVQEGALEVAKGQMESAVAQRDAAAAQKRGAEEQVRITSSRAQADIAAAAAGVERARAGVNEARANTAQRPAYRQNLAALRAAVSAAEAQLRSARAQLSNTVLSSPVDGFVTERFMDPGALAAPGQPVVSVQAIRQVYVQTPVPEEVSRLVYAGRSATVRFDAFPGKSFQAKVASVTPAADPGSRQFTMRLILDNPRSLIKPGMFARVSLVTERVPKAVVVPREAVRQTPEGTHVVVATDAGVAEIRPVTLGAGDSRNVSIRKGLEPGEKVVTLSAAELRDGQEIRVGGQGRREGSPGGGRPARERT